MAYEQRDNSGSLFKNDRKQQDNHPDYNGSIMIDGREYWLSAWLKRSQGGKPFMSIAAKPKEEQPRQQSISQRAMPKGPAKRSIIPDDDMDGDSIPF
jgi:uncharacterized protein (DUF736 family)